MRKLVAKVERTFPTRTSLEVTERPEEASQSNKLAIMVAYEHAMNLAA